MKLSYFILGTFLFIGIFIACQPKNSGPNSNQKKRVPIDITPPETLFELGHDHYKNGNMKAAIPMFVNALEKEKAKANPDKLLLSNIHNIRGEAYMSEGVAILSQSDFIQAIEYDPKNESAYNNMAVWHSIPAFMTPDYTKSLEYFDKALAINPNRKDIRLNKAVVKVQSGDKENGCKELAQLAKEKYPDAKIGIQRFCGN